ncbi:MAG: 50S ribosomal protein L1 [Candidatus Dependentiae bacterium]
MSKHGKKYIEARQSVESPTPVSVKEALDKVKKAVFTKFNESVDVSVNLGIDASKGDQGVRGSVVLPHGRGKVPRVIVFAKGDHAQEAEKAGADFVGAEDLIEKIKNGWMEFDYAVSTPDLMAAVGKLAKLLGPRGLLPNKKLGTVTFEVAAIVDELKKGRAFFKNDKQGIVHFSFGKVSFDTDKLHENFKSFVKAIMSAKPAASKGKYLKKISISSTMGPGISVNPEDVL